jgi:hypothetical protein
MAHQAVDISGRKVEAMLQWYEGIIQAGSFVG